MTILKNTLSIFTIILAILLIASNAKAIGISYTPARMTITAEIDPVYGDFFDRAVKVSNPNNETVNATFSIGEDIFTDHPINFQMKANESKTIWFTIYTKKIGESYNSVGVSFLAINTNESYIFGSNTIGLGTDITLRMSAKNTTFPYPKENMEITSKSGKAYGKITVANPYNFTTTVKIKSDLDADFKTGNEFTMSPGEVKDIDFTINGKDVAGNIYTTIMAKQKEINFITKVVVKPKSSFLVVLIIALAIILIISIIGLSKLKKKSNKDIFG